MKKGWFKESRRHREARLKGMDRKRTSYDRIFGYGGKGFVLEVDGKPYSYSKTKDALNFLKNELLRRGISKGRLRIKPSKIPENLKLLPAVG